MRNIRENNLCVVQCTAPGGGSCGKSVGVGFVGGAAVGAAAGAGGVAAAEAVGAGLGDAIAGGAAGGAIAGAGNYATQSFINGSDMSLGGAWDATWKGAAAGAIGGGVGGAGNYAGSYVGQKAAGMDAEWDKYEFIGSIWKGALSGAAGAAGSQLFSGATGALVGGFSGGAVGSWASGEDKWNILKGGLIGAGSALASYSATWAYGNYEGAEVPEFTPDGEPPVVPKQPDGSFEADGYLKQANKILVDARAEYAEANGLNADEIEAGASFKIKTKFWTGKKYLDHGKIGFGNKTSVEFASRQNDDFRYHLHPADGTQIGAISYASSRHPSPTDYMNVRGYAKYGISNYAAVNTPEGHAEVYHFTYTNKNPQYRISKW